jgi:hypothetical protein
MMRALLWAALLVLAVVGEQWLPRAHSEEMSSDRYIDIAEAYLCGRSYAEAETLDKLGIGHEPIGAACLRYRAISDLVVRNIMGDSRGTQ